MDCPRDANLLVIDDTGRHRRLSCPVCRGMFVAERDVTATLGHKEPKSFESVAQVKVDSVADARIHCPKDGATLKVVRFLDTEIDVCPTCKGLWLDWGEFEKISRRMDKKVDDRRAAPKVVEVEEGPPLTVDGVLDLLGWFYKSARFWRRILK